MTEPLSLLPLRLMCTAKELLPSPHRVTLSSGERGESQRSFLCASHTLLVTQMPLNQILTNVSPHLYLGRLVLVFVWGGWEDGGQSYFPGCPFYCFQDPSSALGVEITTHIPYLSESGPSCLPLTP